MMHDSEGTDGVEAGIRVRQRLSSPNVYRFARYAAPLSLIHQRFHRFNSFDLQFGMIVHEIPDRPPCACSDIQNIFNSQGAQQQRNVLQRCVMLLVFVLEMHLVVFDRRPSVVFLLDLLRCHHGTRSNLITTPLQIKWRSQTARSAQTIGAGGRASS